MPAQKPRLKLGKVLAKAEFIAHATDPRTIQVIDAFVVHVADIRRGTNAISDAVGTVETRLIVLVAKSVKSAELANKALLVHRTLG